MSIPVYNTSIITAVGKVQQGVAMPKFVMGGKGGAGATSYKLFKKDTSYVFSLWRSQKYKIGKAFKINEIRIPLSASLGANMTIIPVVYFDDEASNSIGTTINSTNYPNSDKMIFLTPDNFAMGLSGKKNFYLELQFTGSALIGVVFPITIEAELADPI
jgi:hypothetical protein